MTTIVLHGHLKTLYPHEIRVQANSAAEAIQSLALIPALQQRSGAKHLVQVDNFESVDALFDRREIDVLHIRPVEAGAGRGGMGQILIGAVLIIVAWYNPAGWSILGAQISAGNLMLAGAMMVLGGVMQMLAPQPSLSSNEERSRYLGNGRNTVAIGTRIPMIYGRRKAYGQYISFDVDAGAFDSAPAEWYSSTFTNYGELNHSAAPVDLPISDPQHAYKQPTSFYAGLSYPATMLEEFQTFINFAAVELLAGDYDINFATGQTLHVRNLTSGLTAITTLLGGEIASLPPIGTPIAFTQNYG